MAPAGYLIAAGQQKPKGVTPLTLVPRPLLLYVLALQGWRPCRLSPAPRGKCLRRSGSSPASLTQRRRERQSYQGASGGPDSAANRAAGRADTPRWMPFASQNCPRPYQGESEGLEPSMKPMAGQAGAPLHSLSP